MLKRRTLTMQVFEYIFDLIKTKKVLPGERLPTEKELEQTLGVSRTCVREAVKSLESLGLLQVRPRIGAVVLQPSASAMFTAQTFAKEADKQEGDHLFEFRSIIEVGIASLAAEKASAKDIRVMEACVERHREEIMSGTIDPKTDLSFHAALADATRNPLAQMVWRVISDSLSRIAPLACRIPHLPEDSRRDHQRILHAVQQGDAKRARRAMRAHLLHNAHYLRILKAKGTSLESGVKGKPHNAAMPSLVGPSKAK